MIAMSVVESPSSGMGGGGGGGGRYIAPVHRYVGS